MNAGVDLEQLTRRRLRPLVDVHTSAVLLAVEAAAVGPEEPWAASVLERLAPAQRGAFGQRPEGAPQAPPMNRAQRRAQEKKR